MTDTPSLEGRNVIVTGSTSGIGLGIARAFAEAGANIVINGLGSAKDNEGARAEVAAAGTKVIFSGANMMKSEAISALVDQARQELGAIDIIVNNVGIQHVAPIEDFPEDKWNAILALNLTSAFHLTRFTVGAMKERKWGRIINIASAHSLVASPYKAAYVAAKHGLAGLTKVTALEVAEFGVTCNAISPGYVLTPLVEAQIPDTAKSRGITEEEVKRDVLLAAQSTKKFVTVEQVAGTALFLCSDAAAQITGANISVDGGWTAH
ncbi:MAG: 3-hydroxybutyrate dehydrogenase [Fimbriimonadaceae bacterium]|nr:3-hydroxybutyrate dehydrogenase [Alphaproteobacteria bacterium]